jgi:hypothetical protein
MKIKNFLCKIGIHKYKDVETQITKNISYGFSGCELPGVRLKQICEKCNHVYYMKLNLFMSNEDVWNDNLYRKK